MGNKSSVAENTILIKNTTKTVIENPDVKMFSNYHSSTSISELFNSDNASLATFNKNEYSGDIFKKAYCFADFAKDMRKKNFDLYQRQLLGKSKHYVNIIDKKTVKNKKMIMLASNNYLGLTDNLEIKEAGIKALEKFGSGSGSVPLLAGTMSLHKELEKKIATFKNCEDAVIFSSGYGANVGIISSLIGKNDIVINDKLNHASIIDGCVLSGGTLLVFPHLRYDLLEKKLQKINESKGVLVVTDGVFSMDGDFANLPKLLELQKKYKFRLMIDEAHGTGVIGEKGKGTPSFYNVEGKIDLIMGTLSKSLGGVGGYLAGNREIVDYVRHYARSFVFSTSMPPSTIACLIKAIEILEKDGDKLVARLQNNSKYMRKHLKELGLKIKGDEISPIIPIIIGDELVLRKIHRDLHENNIFTNAISYPAVLKKDSRIRLSIMATHTKTELDITLECIKNSFTKFKIL